MTEENSVAAITDLAHATQVARQVTPGGAPYLIVPRDYRVEDAEKLLPNPTRIKQNVTFTAIDDFSEYVNRFLTPSTTMFVDTSVYNFGSVQAIIDYHAPDKPSWCAHEAHLNPRRTDEFKLIEQINGKLMNQREIADHIEELAPIFRDPSAARMKEIVTTLRGKKSVDWKAEEVLSDGTRKLAYEETSKTRAGQKGDITIPETVKIGVQPFQGMGAYEIDAQLRVHIDPPQVMFAIRIPRMQSLLDRAVGDLKARVAEATGIRPLEIGD